MGHPADAEGPQLAGLQLHARELPATAGRHVIQRLADHCRRVARWNVPHELQRRRLQVWQHQTGRDHGATRVAPRQFTQGLVTGGIVRRSLCLQLLLRPLPGEYRGVVGLLLCPSLLGRFRLVILLATLFHGLAAVDALQPLRKRIGRSAAAHDARRGAEVDAHRGLRAAILGRVDGHGGQPCDRAVQANSAPP